jgi:hypothetical protein
MLPLVSALPDQTTILREPAAELTGRLAALLRQEAQRTNGPVEWDRAAGQLNNLSVRLSDLGRREAALAAIEEAVAIYRESNAAKLVELEGIEPPVPRMPCECSSAELPPHVIVLQQQRGADERHNDTGGAGDADPKRANKAPGECTGSRLDCSWSRCHLSVDQPYQAGHWPPE